MPPRPNASHDGVSGVGLIRFRVLQLAGSLQLAPTCTSTGILCAAMCRFMCSIKALRSSGSSNQIFPLGERRNPEGRTGKTWKTRTFLRYAWSYILKTRIFLMFPHEISLSVRPHKRRETPVSLTTTSAREVITNQPISEIPPKHIRVTNTASVSCPERINPITTMTRTPSSATVSAQNAQVYLYWKVVSVLSASTGVSAPFTGWCIRRPDRIRSHTARASTRLAAPGSGTAKPLTACTPPDRANRPAAPSLSTTSPA